MSRPYTLAFIDIKGDAGQVKRQWQWKLQQEFHPRRAFIGSQNDRYFSLMRGIEGDWHIIAHPGLVWDYASGWFDYDAMKEASLGHDILHWLIARGVIGTEYNDMIDHEFYLILRDCGVPHWRARWLRRGTNTVDQKVGPDREIIYLNHGKRVDLHL